ncbi:MAG: N-methyl-L-tryptophan oxidase [Gemmatimonadaceae bacterium]|nr:N-methyl-L-tryptophan oxidase [Gemmatimonadaceae bacterium]
MSARRIVVAGLGAAGAAAAWRLARQGHHVIGLDRWRPPHSNGSSHGDTRVTRATAWEGAAYVPLAARAHELWDELESVSSRKIRQRCGALFIGEAQEEIVAETLRSAADSDVPVVEVDASSAASRAPGLRLSPRSVVVEDPGAGVLLLDDALSAMLSTAAAAGADLRFDEPLLSWDARDSGVAVRTVRGELEADALILALGAWMPPMLAPLGLRLEIERQTMHWFESASEEDEQRPVLIVTDGNDHATVIFPARNGLVKVAGHGSPDRVARPEDVDREIHAADIAAVQETLDRWLPGRHGAHREAKTCLYTRTPSGHFIVDRHPEHAQVVLASPCNGFGFKFAPALGELVAAMVDGDESPLHWPGWRLASAASS